MQLPRFKIEKKLELAQTLQKLGFSEAFGGNADFKGIADTQPPLKIGGVVHKAFVEACSPTNWAIAAIEYLQVNEKGSEAAAATGIEISKFVFLVAVEAVTSNGKLCAATYNSLFSADGLLRANRLYCKPSVLVCYHLRQPISVPRHLRG